MQLRTITLAMTLVLAGILAAQGDTKGPARTGGGVSGGQIGPAAGIVSGREAVLLGPATRENYCIYRDPDTQRTWEARCTSD